jgi:hypothetical protein|nr:MAG TPA: hypothetical protein [Caudoviricetes sp.]
MTRRLRLAGFFVCLKRIGFKIQAISLKVLSELKKVMIFSLFLFFLRIDK